jgi:hypothetical protein
MKRPDRQIPASESLATLGQATNYLCSSVFIRGSLHERAEWRNHSSTISGSLRTGKLTEFAMKQ